MSPMLPGLFQWRLRAFQYRDDIFHRNFIIKGVLSVYLRARASFSPSSTCSFIMLLFWERLGSEIRNELLTPV